MFQQAKRRDLKVGDLIVVGCSVDGKFVASNLPARIVVGSIWEESPDNIRIDLNSSFGRCKVYAHDENKLWKRIEAHN